MKKKYKIKKLGKVLGIITIIGFALLGVFTCGVLMVSCANHRVESEINNNTTINIKNAVIKDNQYIMGASERDSYQAYLSVCNYVTNINPYYIGWLTPGDTTYVGAMNLVEIGGNNNMDNIVTISTLTPNSTPTIFNARRLRFISSVINAQYFRRHYYYIGFGNDGNYEEYGIEWSIFTDIQGSTLIDGQNTPLFNANFIHWNDWRVLPYTTLETTDYAFSFSTSGTMAQIFDAYLHQTPTNDYASGYANGYGIGYNNGYDVGRTDLNINGANPFNLIESAFNSLAAILDIKILPYLSLGTLIFIPLIISIVIVVVKVVKG